MVKRLYDKHLLTTLKKHSQFLKCGISKLENSTYVSKLFQNFKIFKAF
jgi:hypothetical protein